MENIVRTESIEKPKSILDLGNNNYYYNYDIKPSKIKGEKEEVDGWSYIPIYINGNPEYKKTVKYTIRKFITQEEEFDLINSYNKSILLKSKETNLKYLEYLKLIDNIKKEISNVFNK